MKQALIALIASTALANNPTPVSLTFTAAPNAGASQLQAGLSGMWAAGVISNGSTLAIVPPGSALYLAIDGGDGKASYVGLVARVQVFAAPTGPEVIVTMTPDDNALAGFMSRHYLTMPWWRGSGPHPAPPAGGRPGLVDGMGVAP